MDVRPTVPGRGPGFWVRTAVAAALVATVALYAVTVIHDFYTRVDRVVYTAVDDAEANIAYSLATRGRYAFPASPVLLDESRLHGQFNYGPWYFYLAAGVVWIFGFSLTAIRAIHLWVVVGAAVAAFLWFRGRDRIAAPALFALTILYFFSVIQWPMVRPDSLVSAFALAVVVSAGLAFRQRRARWWLIAGWCAACGAFTHLIAASLIASAVALYLWFAFVELRETRNRRETTAAVWRSGIALAAGLAGGAAMFYASFGFDVAMQWRFLNGYRGVTATGESFAAALRHHFLTAFGYFPAWLQAAVGITFVASWIVVVAAPARWPGVRNTVRGYLLPAATVWTLYALSNGKYTNYHLGYAVLHQVMFPWTAAALIFVVFGFVESRGVRVARLLGTLAAIAVLVLAIRRVQARGLEPYGTVQGAQPVTFSDYANHVLGPLPERATAWGTVFFGVESPDRLQLVQQSDATALMPRIPETQRAALAPDYLVLGYPEMRDNLATSLRGGDSYLATMSQVLPGMRFRLVALTSGWPYGVTRVYARTSGAAGGMRGLPAVAAYDADHGRWYSRVGAPSPIAFRAAAPATLRIGYEASPAPKSATATVVADVPAGQYLLRVGVEPGADGTTSRLIAVTSSGMLTQTISELGPRGDFAAYLHEDREVVLLSDHPGGPLFVNQFDRSTGASITGVTVYPIVGLLDVDERPAPPNHLPPFSAWRREEGVRVSGDDTHVIVEGDDSPYGYQFSSPVVRAGAGDRIELDLPNVVRRGRVCVGALNADGSRWLVLADTWREQMRFDVDKTLGFRVIFANCRDRVANDRSLFDVTAGAYLNHTQWYADRLVEAVYGPARR